MLRLGYTYSFKLNKLRKAFIGEHKYLEILGYIKNCSSSTNANLPNAAAKNFLTPNSKAELRQQRNNGIQIQYGQPTPATHPHLLKENEITPEVHITELQERRNRLMERIQKYILDLKKNIRNHLVVIPSATKRYMSDKIPYVFRQNSDFFYFSGCLEPDSILVLTINERSEIKSILFVRPKDKHAELWDGPRTGVEVAPDFFGVDEAYSVKDFAMFISNYIKTYQANFGCWCDLNTNHQPDITYQIKQAVNNQKDIQIESPLLFFHQLRVIKSPAEINLMRTTTDIGSRSLNKTIFESKPGDSEHHLFARVDYHSRMNNANYLAYPPVVAAGNNATTIHYVNNTQIIKPKQLVLMDAGCEYGGYTSDITRTWPIDGHFTSEQRVLYEIVLTVQKELIATLLKDGGKTLDDLFDTMCYLLGKYLQEIGLIPKSVSNLELARLAYKFCPHHVSHYLGMDVHDTPLISRSAQLQSGMVCTVEPGIYIPLDRTDVPESFRGIGLRIEDDVLINENSVEVLTEKCVKEVNELETLIKSK